ncbi:MAG: Tic22 family protein [Xenococcaceae cyanobacterium]
MIRKLACSSAVLGMVSTVILSLGFGHNLKAWALPTEQVLQKLNPVPVFTITNDKGVPLLLSGKDEAQVAGIFINPQDAEVFINDLKTKNPDLGNQVQVTLVSLGEVYKLAQAEQTKENDILFNLIPEKTEVESAKTILSQSGQEYKGGVPLFVAKVGSSNEYLVMGKDSQQIIPLFFEKEQLEKMVNVFKQQKPDLAETVTIEVVPLENIIATLQSSDDETLTKIKLVPSSESQEFVREKAAEQGGGNQQQPQQ